MPVPAMAAEVFFADAVPNTSASVPSYTSNATNVVNTPQATGAISVPQSPSGAVVTNTGRSNHATRTYMAQLNALNQGTTPPPAKN